MSNHYDLFVIGAGPGGYEAAIKAAQLGMKVALAEKDKIGGTCLNRGCIPTKALLHAAGIYQELKSCEEYGISAKECGFQMDGIYEYKNNTLEQLRQGTEQLIVANGITILRGSACIQPDKKIQMNLITGEVEEYEADYILIATGSMPMPLSIPGVELPGVLTSDDILDRNQNMQKLLIIGGGVIGVEFATIFSSFGCEVTIIEAMPSLLSNLDREISQNLKMIFKKRGINIYCDSVFQKAEIQDKLICTFTQKDKTMDLETDKILIAVGRKANIEGLFAGGLSPELTKGRVKVDENFVTSIPGIYAIGDVIGGKQLAHLASAQGIAAVEHMKDKKPAVNLEVVPACVYTNPEIASVGITEEEAKKMGVKVKTGKFIMSANGKSIITKEERGFIKLIFEEETEILLGAHLMCARATDMIGELTLAITNKLNIDGLSLAMRAHPTYEEAIGEAVLDSRRQAIHIAPRRSI